MEKIFYSNRIEKELLRAYNNNDNTEFKRIYNGVMAPVDRSKYTDESMYLEDVEWDLEGKRQMCSLLLNPNTVEVKVVAEMLA